MGMFDGFAGAALGGGASLLGGILTNNAQQDIAQQSMAFSAQQSQAQMDFQKQMRATQYQTAVDDLKAAGLNPMLAYTQGGAGTPTGSAAVGQQAQLRNPAEGFAHSASMLANTKADLELKDAQTTEAFSRTTANEQMAQKTNAETAAVIETIPNLKQELKNKLALETLNKAQAGVSSATEANTRMDIKLKQIGDLPEAINKGSYHQKAPYNPNYIKDISQGVSSAAQAVGAAKGTSVLPTQYQYRK